MNYSIETLFPEVLSSTRDIELYVQCPFKWFTYRAARFCKYVYNNDLEAGKEFAKAMELTRNAYYKLGKDAAEAVEIGVRNIEESFGESYAEADYKDELKTPAKLAEVFRQMFEENPLDSTSIIPFEMEDGGLSVEQDFSVTLPFNHPETGKPLILKCLLDMLGTKQNTVYVVDEKTCKSVLTDAIKQADLLRTQNQFVQYVTVANMNKEKFGDLNVTHVRINRCKIKKTYTKGEKVVEPYEFAVDVWFQKTWWNNLLYIVQSMLSKYEIFLNRKSALLTNITEDEKEKIRDKVIFPRAYGNACTAFFKPCSLTYHCTSGNAQNLFDLGWKQVVCDSRTNYEEVPLIQYKKQLLEGVNT